MSTNSDFSYALNILWLLTENEIIQSQIRKGYSFKLIVDDLKETITASNCLSKYSDDIKRELTNSLFFIITKRIEETAID